MTSAPKVQKIEVTFSSETLGLDRRIFLENYPDKIEERAVAALKRYFPAIEKARFDQLCNASFVEVIRPDGANLPWHLRWMFSQLLDRKPKRARLEAYTSKEHTFFLCRDPKRAERFLSPPMYVTHKEQVASVTQGDSGGDALNHLVGDFLLFTYPAIPPGGVTRVDYNRDYGVALTADLTWSRNSVIAKNIKFGLLGTQEPWFRGVLRFPQPDFYFVIRSHHVRHALREFSRRTWQQPTVRRILLTAPPGSGKEEFVRVLAAGLLENSNPAAYGKMSFAGVSGREVPKMLEDFIGSDKRLFFFDEIHQAPRSLYTILLRVLEENEFKGKDLKEKWFVFAASEEYEKLRQRDPPDFWTRIETVHSIHQPLDIQEDDGLKEALEGYFEAFWRREIAEFGKKSKAEDALFSQRTSEFFARDRVIGVLRQQFADEIVSAQVPVRSVRHVRTIVRRTWNSLAHAIRVNAPRDGSYSDEWAVAYLDRLRCRDVLRRHIVAIL